MRSVFTFSRSAAETTAALSRIFSSGGTAREQLSLHAEMLVEPVGWDALWKLSKEFCKKFEVRFPTVAYISVTSVDFEALTACVEVQSVQHEAVSLPETVQDVPLIELWPTVKQQELCVNAATTAEFIDLMRFFYNNIWMPWDEQDDKILLPNTIEERMQLWTELHNGTIPHYVARAVMLLRNSAIDAHDRLKELDSSLCEDSGDEDDSLLPANYITLCAELTAKLDTHMAKWTLYEKALIRNQYLAKQKTKWQKLKSKKNVVALWQGGSAFDFGQISQYLRSHLSPEHTLTITPSAEDALTMEPEELVVCSKHYEIPEMPLSRIVISSFNGATLKSADTRSCLLNLSEECTLRELSLQCARVNTAVVVRAGTCALNSCHLLDDSSSSQSDFVQGIVAMPDATLLIENTTFDNFYSGIVVHKGARSSNDMFRQSNRAGWAGRGRRVALPKCIRTGLLVRERCPPRAPRGLLRCTTLELRNCSIKNCGVGIQMYSGAEVALSGTSITNCAEHCIRAEVDISADTKNVEGLHIQPSCTIGSGDLRKEILVVRQEVDLI